MLHTPYSRSVKTVLTHLLPTHHFWPHRARWKFDHGVFWHLDPANSAHGGPFLACAARPRLCCSPLPASQPHSQPGGPEIKKIKKIKKCRRTHRKIKKSPSLTQKFQPAAIPPQWRLAAGGSEIKKLRNLDIKTPRNSELQYLRNPDNEKLSHSEIQRF